MTSPGNLDSAQQEVLRDNMLSGIESGLASRYFTTQREHARRLARLAGLTGEPALDILQEASDDTSLAAGAETPFLFTRRPSNMAEELVVLRANPQTGEILHGSDVQIGLVGGLAGEGHPVGIFTPEDIISATESIAAQEAVGLQAS